MKTWILVALLALTVAVLTVVVVAGDNDVRCRYSVAGGRASIEELPCGLDAAGLRTYVGKHPELVAPKIPRLSPN